MERYYYCRGESIPIIEMENMVAVKVDPNTPTVTDLGFMGNTISATREMGFAYEVPEMEQNALAAAGWSFIRPNNEFARADSFALSPQNSVGQVEQVYQKGDGHLFISSRYLTVQFKPNYSSRRIQRTLFSNGLNIVRQLAFAPNLFLVSVPPNEDPLTIANRLQERNIALAAEPDFYEYLGQRLKPQDQRYNQQWHLNNTGENGGLRGADISAEAAWDFTLGRGTKVAVIDNGFNVRHRDLAPGIIDQSGYFDQRGIFRQTLDNYPDIDHGTFCAGMVGARHNNSHDGCGSAPECDLMLIATSDQQDQIGTQTALARAVAYAADPRMEIDGESANDGADVIVCSLGPNVAVWTLTTVLENAINFAAQQGRAGRGTPIFWASSNGHNVDIAEDQVVSHPNVIAVGRSNRNDLEDHSAQGEELDFLAPGVDVLSTVSRGGTGIDSGTSYAAPLSAGIGALVLSINPKLTAREVRQIMRSTCDKIGGNVYDENGHNNNYGYGRVNAFKAVLGSLQSLTEKGNAFTEMDGDGRAEIPVVSPAGIAILDYRSNSLQAPTLVSNGRRMTEWVLNTEDNKFPVIGDLNGGGLAELLVTSPWGIGVLRRNRTSFQTLMMAPNGTQFSHWQLNTVNDIFGPTGRFLSENRHSILVRNPSRLGIIELVNTVDDTLTLSPPIVHSNGARLGEWVLNTTANTFGPIGDFDGDGLDEILVTSSWGIGILKAGRRTLSPIALHPNGTRIGNWILDTFRNWIGPVGDFDGDGQAELVIASPDNIGIFKLQGDVLTPLQIIDNSSRIGNWRLNTLSNRLLAAADLDGDGRDELLITTPTSIGVLGIDRRRLTSLLVAINGTRFGNWVLNTEEDQFKVLQNITGASPTKAELLVKSSWGIGIMRMEGDTFEVPFMRPNGSRLGRWLLNTEDNRF